MLHGKGFLLDIDGEEKHHGFVTTRWVRAVDEKRAEFAAVDLIKEDKKLIDLTINANAEEPNPMIYLEEIMEVSWLTYICKKPGAGYSFYSNEEKQN